MPPPVLLGLTIATLYGCAAHAMFGRRLWQWPIFWVSAVIGFFSGYAAGIALGIAWLRVGSMPLLASTVGAALAIWLCWFFTAPLAGGDAGATAPDQEPPRAG